MKRDAARPRCGAGWREMSPLSCGAVVHAQHRWTRKGSRQTASWAARIHCFGSTEGYNLDLAQKQDASRQLNDWRSCGWLSASTGSTSLHDNLTTVWAVTACLQISDLLLRCRFFCSHSISAAPRGELVVFTGNPRDWGLNQQHWTTEPMLDFFCYGLSDSIVNWQKENNQKLYFFVVFLSLFFFF